MKGLGLGDLRDWWGLLGLLYVKAVLGFYVLRAGHVRFYGCCQGLRACRAPGF